jgi:hypothetical protein
VRIRLSITAWVAVLVAVGALVSACGASTDSEEDSAGSPAASSTPADEVALRDAPEVGTCWRLRYEDLRVTAYWFDDSPQVPCTEPHNTETAYVYALDEPTAEAAKALAEVCWDRARRYVEVNLDNWVPWAFGMLLPSQQQVTDGASFLRCEVLFPANLALTEYTSLTYSVKGAATTRADELLPCLDASPDMRRQPFLSCGKPHRYEATGQLASVVSVAYPPPKVLRSEAAQCRYGLPRRQDTPEHAITVAWDGPEGFDGGELVGVCFVYRRDGNLLPARK